MEENRTSEVLHEADEVALADETSEESGGTRRQFAKYAAVWVGIIGLFLVFNVIVKSVAATNATDAVTETANYTDSYYSNGQPVAAQPAATGTDQTGAAVGAGAGACGGPGSGGCGGPGSATGAAAGAGDSCCGGTGSATAQTNTTTQTGATTSTGTSGLQQVEKAALAWYVEQTGDSNVTAEVLDFGCHQQINIKKGGKVVNELQYRDGQFSFLTPWQ